MPPHSDARQRNLASCALLAAVGLPSPRDLIDPFLTDAGFCSLERFVGVTDEQKR
jgi:hypothetical protein